jgi:hypothetical protein
MKLTYRIRQMKSSLVLRYEAEEWDALKRKYEDFGLQIRVSPSSFGRDDSTPVSYYSRPDGESVAERLGFTSSEYSVDSIREPAISNAGVNFVIFRVVPNQKLEVSIPIEKLLTVTELNKLILRIKSVYSTIFNISNSADIEVKIKAVEGE